MYLSVTSTYRISYMFYLYLQVAFFFLSSVSYQSRVFFCFFLSFSPLAVCTRVQRVCCVCVALVCVGHARGARPASSGELRIRLDRA